MITHKLHLDVSKDGVQGNIVLVKGERASRDISFTFSNGKNTVELGEDYSAAFRGIKPDGNELFNSCVVYTENGVYPNTVRYHVTEQTVTAAGTFTARLLIWNREGEVLWSPEFSVTVKEHGSLDSDVESQSEFTALIDAAVQAQNAAKQTENVAAETKKEVGEWLEERDAALGDHVADRVNPHGVTAKQLGLERVDNTSDEEKPLSAAARAAFAALGGELSAAEAELIDRIAQALISAKFYADDTKVGKVGDQVINGRLSISGDLLVEGDTYAKQIESLEVGDAVIIANADGVLLSELSGYVIRVSGDSAYAIVYDPADDCVKIGLGTYNSETKLFVFLEGEAQVLATRGVISDGHVPVWNDAKKTFEDSGKTADKVVERGADIPNGEIPVIKDGKLIGSGKTASSFASKDSAQVVANALKGSASGEIVALKDVSPLEHNIGVRVSSKNLMNSDLFGNLFEKQEDGSYLSTEKIYADDKSQAEVDLPADIYTLSFYLKCPVGCDYRFMLIHEDGTKTDAYIASTGDYIYKSVTTNGKAIKQIGFSYNSLSNEVQFKELQIEKGTTATAYTSYVADIGAVNVKKYGKNVADIKYFSATTLGSPIESSNHYGTTISTTDGRANELVFTQSFATPDVDYETHFDNGFFVIALNPIIPVGAKTVLSFDLEITEDILGKSILGVGTNGSYMLTYAVHNGRNTFVLPAWGEPKKKGANGIEVRIVGKSGIMSNIQLEVGETATEYELCKEPVEYTVNPDGTVDGVKSIAPATTLTTDTEGVLIEVEYNRDINDAFAELKQAIILLGGII